MCVIDINLYTICAHHVAKPKPRPCFYVSICGRLTCSQNRCVRSQSVLLVASWCSDCKRLLEKHFIDEALKPMTFDFSTSAGIQQFWAWKSHKRLWRSLPIKGELIDLSIFQQEDAIVPSKEHLLVTENAARFEQEALVQAINRIEPFLVTLGTHTIRDAAQNKPLVTLLVRETCEMNIPYVITTPPTRPSSTDTTESYLQAGDVPGNTFEGLSKFRHGPITLPRVIPDPVYMRDGPAASGAAVVCTSGTLSHKASVVGAGTDDPATFSELALTRTACVQHPFIKDSDCLACRAVCRPSEIKSNQRLKFQVRTS